MIDSPENELIADYGLQPAVLNPRTQAVTDEAISIPYNFIPRDYQEKYLFREMFPHHYPELRALGVPAKKRVCAVWHRRAGKDKSLINALCLAALEKVGNYLYLLPEQTQARKIIWRGIDGNGFRFLDHIPDEICQGGARGKYSSEMLVELKTGSTIQIGGSDNYNSWMGTNPLGIVFSEYSLQDPMAWQYFRPILVENGGWAVFNFTVRGKNHGYDLAKTARENPRTWGYSYLTIDDTKREDGSPVITKEQYLQEIEEGMPEPIARQEFYCDWEAAMFGSYYGDLMATLFDKKRIGFYPYDPTKLVYTAWDIGLDCNAVWFAQQDDGGIRLIDYWEEVNAKFSTAVKVVLEKPYAYGAHFGPHDIENRNPEKETRIDTALALGIEFVVTPRMPLADGIEAVREMLPRCRFHAEATERGVDCLKSYERVFDRKLQQHREQPVHNWASHGSDAFRALALNWENDMEDDSWFNKKLDIPTPVDI